MRRIGHGSSLTIEELNEARQNLAVITQDVDLAFAAAAPPSLTRFDFLFRELQDDPANLLPESNETPERLRTLGRTLHDTSELPSGDSPIPAAYTYFGQFVDHDVTLDLGSGSAEEL